MSSRSFSLMSSQLDKSSELKSYMLGTLSVAAFALTLPASKQLTGSLSGLDIGIFRSLIAAMAACVLIIVVRPPFPSKKQLRKLLLTSLGIVYGFPVLTAVGMKYVPVSHGAIVLAALPFATAIFGTLITKKMPSLKFWVYAIAGSALVAGYTAYVHDEFSLYLGDLALLGAVLFAGFGYAQGGSLSSEMKSWAVMSWMLVISTPVLFCFALLIFDKSDFANFQPIDYASLLFLALINSFFAFFTWYYALALGGVQRISQIQLLQPFLTLMFTAVFMAEHVDALTLVVSFLVIAIVWASKRA